MKLVTTKCPNCNAAIELNEKLEKGICQYCGETVYVKEALEKKKVELTGNVNVTVDNNTKKIKNIKNYIKLEDLNNAKSLLNEVLNDDPFNLEALAVQTEIDYKELVNQYSIEEEFKAEEYEEEDLKELRKSIILLKKNLEKIEKIDDNFEFSNIVEKYNNIYNQILENISSELKDGNNIKKTSVEDDASSNKNFLFIIIIVAVILVIVLLTSREEKKEATSNETTTSTNVAKEDASINDAVNVYVFYGSECPHCENLFDYLDTLKSSSIGSHFNLVIYEVWNNESNNDLMNKVAQKFGVEISGVPFYVIGEKYYSGYSTENDEEIKNQIEKTYNNNYDVMKDLN